MQTSWARLPRVGKREGPLADVEELLLQVGEDHVRVLVEQPHHLGGVHRRTAAEGDDGVRPEGAHLLGAGGHGADGRLGLDRVDDLQGHLLGASGQGVDDLVGEPEPGHRRVGHDGHPVHVRQVDQVPDGVRLEEGLARHLEPLQVVVPPADPLDVDQVDRRHVAGDGVVAVRAAAQRQRRQERVVDVTDAAQ